MITDRYTASISQFACEMGHRLSENEEKHGNFEEWTPTILGLVFYLSKNLTDLIKLLLSVTVDKDMPVALKKRISAQAADLANFAMRAHQLFGNQEPDLNRRRDD